eukprot:NODE_3449_length_666_cov_100.009724_g2457_i0.p2 GENE.NODE_3449_length_666_cov_100.009724_g2457_i0~~NODE_3449_length_666_cov_100.009724_g2457_i0.p2  ORF type:complete len:87 (-),score=27.15 NODE_3449_length_666_cov_100.009724_g2457_i0:406-645(-)
MGGMEAPGPEAGAEMAMPSGDWGMGNLGTKAYAEQAYLPSAPGDGQAYSVPAGQQPAPSSPGTYTTPQGWILPRRGEEF